MGAFGVYTRWAVVFLIIFVLFFLLCPTVEVIKTGKHVTIAHYDSLTMTPVYTHMPHMSMGGMHGMHGIYGSSPSSLS
ncbi:hypothetical protein ACOJUR_06525 [Alicyclobacillus tolerans]|uniref:ABC-type microcin C transport system permease subunit YejE n=2 Tax=Alicyclobacillus tolerans TaxID=90970 RepID=A0ABT9LVL4_9BACL|nr:MULTISPECIES: hypothetical protein [Alicyclobacillus]MDP9728312.1 ABC-type microcin C transport system permease subunit YejE [Alicyclobacillus tengchongensis]SHJ94953.1 hypothetical protein SAMN05443507_10641 [Alicyclobacillus montanus]